MPTSLPSVYRVSNTTIKVSSNADPSNVNVTSTVPFFSSGVNVAEAVTSLSSTRIALPVALFISTPFTVYSLSTSSPS